MRFDRNIEVLEAITRVSALFDVGCDETLVRSQFPLCMAFGVTAHKCQGLSIDNALIRTSKMFADGQAFVAFSRVRQLFGLHLIDLDPTKIVCDVDSLIEYNRLRQTINLSQIDVPIRQAKKRAPSTRQPTNLTVKNFYCLLLILL